MKAAGKTTIDKILVSIPASITAQFVLTWNFSPCHTHAPFTNRVNH